MMYDRYRYVFTRPDLMLTVRYTLAGLYLGPPISNPEPLVFFSFLQMNPYTAVGFLARAYTQPLLGWSKYKYKMNKINGGNYSIVLVDVAFLHREYFRLYTETLPEGMARLVDRLNNCEDLAMSFLVSNLCKCASGLHVEPRTAIIHLTGKKGLSGRSNHPRNRGVCISTYSHHFQEMPLKNINCVYY